MNRFFFECAAVYLGAAALCFGADPSFDFTVASGPHERHNVPVRVEVSRDRVGKEQIASVTVTGADGKPLPAQWTGPGFTSNAAGELHFILPHLAAGESVRLK